MIVNHLRQDHGINHTTPRQERRIRIQGAIHKATERAAEKAIEHRRKSVISTPQDIFNNFLDPSVIAQLVVRWVVRCSVPLAMPHSAAWIGSANTVFKWNFRTRDAEKGYPKEPYC